MSKGTPIKRLSIEKPINQFLDNIKENASRIEICGSYRREAEQISDIDILVEPKNYISLVFQLEDNGFASGPQRIFFSKKIDIPIEITFVMNKNQWGSQLIHHTGPYQFNIFLRSIAKKLNMKLNQYGLWRGCDNIADGKSETEIFQLLGVSDYHPVKRSLFKDEEYLSLMKSIYH